MSSAKARSQQRRNQTESRLFFWLLAAAYLVILIVSFREFVFSNLTLYGSDTMQSGFYMKALHTKALRAGELIEWIPYLYGGLPFVDAFHSDIFYVPSWPFHLALDLHRALGWVLIAHFWLGGMAMYLAARHGWSLRPLPSAVAGLAYMLAPYFISMTLPGHGGRIFVVAWFPLGFMLLKWIWDRGRLRDMGLFAVVVGLIILSPHVQMAYFSLWAYAAYSVYRTVRRKVTTGTLPWRAGLGSLGAVLVALGISAVQFYPSYQYVKNHSPRSGDGLNYQTASSWSLHQEEFVNLVVPEFSGISNLNGNTYWGRNRVKDRLEYGGVVALWLALVAVFATRARDRWFFFGLGACATLYALGAHTPVFRLFYLIVPNVKLTRAPAMIMFLFVFSTSLGAAMALDALYERSFKSGGGRPRLLWYLSGAVLLAALALTLIPEQTKSAYLLLYSDISSSRLAILNGRLGDITSAFWLAAGFTMLVAALYTLVPARHRLWVVIGMAALVTVDGARMNRNFIQPVNHRDYFPEEPVLQFLSSQSGTFRVFDAASYVRRSALPDWVDRPSFMTNYFGYYGFNEVTGYHGNQLRTYNALLGGAGLPRLTGDDAERLMDLACVRYVLYNRRPNMDGALTDTSLVTAYERFTRRLYENSNRPDQARLVTCWEQHDPVDTLYTRLFTEDFDHLVCVVVDSALPFESYQDTLPMGSVQITTYDAEAVEIRVDSRGDALLVLADNNYPAWHATLDGQPVPIITTNATFRGVVVSAGLHTVRFEYRSARQTVGIVITILATLMALTAMVIDRKPAAV